MLCFTQIYQISYPSHISLLSALYSPSAYCPNFQDGPLPGPTPCTFPNGRMPLPALTGYPTPRRPSSARSQLQPYGCNHFSKKGDCTCGPFRLLYGWIVNNNAAEPQRG